MKLSKDNLRYCFSVVIAFVTGTLIGWLFLLSFEIEPKERAGVINSLEGLLEKFMWIVTRPLVLAFRPFTWDSPSVQEVFLPVLLLVICAYTLWSRAGIKLPALVGVLFLLMLLPLLPISENQIEFRILPTTSAAGLLLIIYCIDALMPNRIKETKYINAAASVTLILIAVHSYSATNSIFVKPYQVSKEFIEKNLTNIKGPSLRYSISYENWPMRDFIGAPSAIYDLQMPWVVVPMLEVFAKDRFSTIEEVLQMEKSKGNFIDLDELKILETK